MTTDWAHLTHAYGSAADTPGLFARLDGGPGDKDVWADLWSSLCHQGTVYDASFAALPLLTDIATGRAPGAHPQSRHQTRPSRPSTRSCSWTSWSPASTPT